MTTLGIDFDNTIVIYDKLFKEIALKRKLVTNNIDEDKKIIRDYLRKKGMERELFIPPISNSTLGQQF